MGGDDRLLGATLARGFVVASEIRWPLVRASEIFELRYGKALVESNRTSGSVPVYGTNGQCGTHDRHLFEGPGVVLGRKGQGPLGVEWVPGNYWVIDTAYSLAPVRDDIDLKFAYYLIKYVGLNHLKDGTSNPSLSRDTFGAQLFPIPPLNDQCAIAHILGTLDDKIELNSQTNETLEAMARALFKSWFVDFDPVRAKAEGRQPSGMDAETVKLFPSEFEESELREIPKGWRAGTLAELASLNPEAWSKVTRPIQINYVDLSNTKWGRIEAVTRFSRDNAPSRAQRVLRPRDTIVGTVRPGNGSYAFVVEEGLTGSTGFTVLRPLKSEYAEFVYLSSTSSTNIEALSLFADGGAYPAVRPELVASRRVAIACDPVLEAFSRATQPLFVQVAANGWQSHSLVALRDTLLPRLLSGELSVASIQQIKGAT